MAFYYFDSSAVVKRYVLEPGSGWVRRLWNEHSGAILISWLAVPESAAAFAVCRRVGKLTSREARLAYRQLEYDLAEQFFRLVPLTLDIARLAADLTQRYALKGYDAVQVATALTVAQQLRTLDEDLVFVSGDRQTLKAAQKEGLSTDDPGDHTELDPAFVPK